MKKGFSLIELLVVLVIVGVLGAVALPYYQNAVQSARVTEAVSLWGRFKRLGAGRYMTAQRAARYERELNDNGGLKYFALKLVCRDTETDRPCWEAELRQKNESAHVRYYLTTQNNFAQLVCVPLNGAGENFCRAQSAQDEEPDARIGEEPGYVMRF